MSKQFDIVVIGSGAAGIAAAVSAARADRMTLLLDKNPAAGGTGGFSGLTTLCGLYDDAGNFLNDGFAREFAETLTDTLTRGISPRSEASICSTRGQEAASRARTSINSR